MHIDYYFLIIYSNILCLLQSQTKVYVDDDRANIDKIKQRPTVQQQKQPRSLIENNIKKQINKCFFIIHSRIYVHSQTKK